MPGKQILVTAEQAADILDTQNEWRAFQVDWKPRRVGNFAIEEFYIEPHSEQRLRFLANEGQYRDPGSGTFRRMVEFIPGAGPEGSDKKMTWMSDSRAEILEHMPAINQLIKLHDKGIQSRVLINGLGLGMVVQAAVVLGASQVDVVESNEDVIELTGHYFDDTVVNIWHDDAMDIQWPKDYCDRWDVAWHDIWPTISDDNVPQMQTLKKRYRGLVGWQGCWQWAGSWKMYKMLLDLENKTLDPQIALDFITGRFNPNERYPRR